MLDIILFSIVMILWLATSSFIIYFIKEEFFLGYSILILMLFICPFFVYPLAREIEVPLLKTGSAICGISAIVFMIAALFTELFRLIKDGHPNKKKK